MLKESPGLQGPEPKSSKLATSIAITFVVVMAAFLILEAALTFTR